MQIESLHSINVAKLPDFIFEWIEDANFRI
jgi:hypothetical protein